MWWLLKNVMYPKRYIWIDVILVKETPKAILIMFDDKEAWLPKAWIWGIKRNKDKPTIQINISEYHWAKKFG